MGQRAGPRQPARSRPAALGQALGSGSRRRHHRAGRMGGVAVGRPGVVFARYGLAVSDGRDRPPRRVGPPPRTVGAVRPPVHPSPLGPAVAPDRRPGRAGRLRSAGGAVHRRGSAGFDGTAPGRRCPAGRWQPCHPSRQLARRSRRHLGDRHPFDGVGPRRRPGQHRGDRRARRGAAGGTLTDVARAWKWPSSGRPASVCPAYSSRPIPPSMHDTISGSWPRPARRNARDGPCSRSSIGETRPRRNGGSTPAPSFASSASRDVASVC